MCWPSCLGSDGIGHAPQQGAVEFVLDRPAQAGVRNLPADLIFGFELLDEAHASGVYGTNGAGLANELGVTEAVDVFIVTLSKAIGLSGGALVWMPGIRKGGLACK